MRHPYFDVPVPTVIGHRGAAGERPENTLISFEHALAQGAAILESDVHLTSDGVPVLIHDDEVGRTTDGTGAVGDFSLAALQRFDAGFRFSADGTAFPYRKRGLRIPTLEQALQAFPRARWNLELKEGRPGLVERTVEIVARLERAATTLLTSGDDRIMRTLRAYLGRSGVPVALGASSAEVAAFLRAALEGRPPPPGPMALQVPPEFGGQPVVTPAFVRHAHAYGLAVHVWTVNEPAEMTRLLDLGVDGLVTDFPARLARLIGARAGAA